MDPRRFRHPGSVQCDFCSLRFGSSIGVTRHKLRVHQDSFHTDFYCTECCTYFATKRALRLHPHSPHNEPVKERRVEDQQKTEGVDSLDECLCCGDMVTRREVAVHALKHCAEVMGMLRTKDI